MITYSLYNPQWFDDRYYPEVVAYYFRTWHEYHMAFHAHNQVEIMYVIKGKCKVETPEYSFRMKKGDFILLDANVAHNLLVEKDALCRMLNVEFIFAKKEGSLPSFRELALEVNTLTAFLKQKDKYILLKDSEEVYLILKSLISELNRSKREETMVQLLLAQLMVNIARLAQETGMQQGSTENLYVKKAVNYLNHHYDCDIRAEDVASVVNIHVGYLHRIFKNHTGYTLMEYLTRIRLEKVKMLLKNTDIPIIDICHYVGINSRQYLTYLFKKHTGVTPANYRKNAEKIVKN